MVEALGQLGVSPGDSILVHSSLSAIGDLEGGTDSLIDALLDAVGPEGLIVVPTFAGPQPFDPKTTPTPLGAVADSLWRRPDAFRSSHPTHSVAAIGAGAEELVRGHEEADTGYGEGTPYHKLATSGGKVLLIGVDQDRNTMLHTAEALADAAYLDDVEASYVDSSGKTVTIPVRKMAGPHRNFIGLEPLFRSKGLMTMGRVGKAVCRLMDAGGMVEATLEALREDPAAVLCDNPACADCGDQRTRIKAKRLEGEPYKLAAVTSEISDRAETIIETLAAEGISAVETTADEYDTFGPALREAGFEVVAIAGGDEASVALAQELGVPVIVSALGEDTFRLAARLAGDGVRVLVENIGARSSVYERFFEAAPNAGFAFNPSRFAQAGEKPFLEVFYKGALRKQTDYFYLDDGTFDGETTLPGEGNGEVKEILSMLRCRSFSGIVVLRSRRGGRDTFKETARAFWRLLDTI